VDRGVCIGRRGAKSEEVVAGFGGGGEEELDVERTVGGVKLDRWSGRWRCRGSEWSYCDRHGDCM
jgi:hypothetical protein